MHVVLQSIILAVDDCTSDNWCSFSLECGGYLLSVVRPGYCLNKMVHCFQCAFSVLIYLNGFMSWNQDVMIH